jgi:hypothetical protein
MPIYGVLILVTLTAIVALLPMWPYARKWGFAPSGWASMDLLIFIGLVLSHVV